MININRIRVNGIDLDNAEISIEDPGADSALLQSSGDSVEGTLVSGSWVWDSTDIASAGLSFFGPSIVTFTMPDLSEQHFVFIPEGAPVLNLKMAVAIDGLGVSEPIELTAVDCDLAANSSISPDLFRAEAEGDFNSLTMSAGITEALSEVGFDTDSEVLLKCTTHSSFAGMDLHIVVDGLANDIYAEIDEEGVAYFKLYKAGTSDNAGLYMDQPILEILGDESLWYTVGFFKEPWTFYISIPNGESINSNVVSWKKDFSLPFSIYDPVGEANENPWLLEVAADKDTIHESEAPADGDLWPNSGYTNPLNTFSHIPSADEEYNYIYISTSWTNTPEINALKLEEGYRKRTIIGEGASTGLPVDIIHGYSLPTKNELDQSGSFRIVYKIDPYLMVSSDVNVNIHSRNTELISYLNKTPLRHKWTFEDAPIVLGFYDSVSEEWYYSVVSGTPAADEYTTPLLVPNTSGTAHSITLPSGVTVTHWAVFPLRGKLSAMFSGETVEFQHVGGGSTDVLIDLVSVHDDTVTEVASISKKWLLAPIDEATVSWVDGGVIGITVDSENISGLPANYWFNIASL